MPTPFVLQLPAGDTEMRAEVERGLAPYADVRAAPPSLDLGTIALVVGMVAGSTAIVANGIKIYEFLYSLKQRHASGGRASGIRIGQVGEQGMPLEDIDDVALRRIVGAQDP
jgi:hypothetical protein